MLDKAVCNLLKEVYWTIIPNVKICHTKFFILSNTIYLNQLRKVSPLI